MPGQGGLGDVVLHPQFASNRLVYLSWAEEGEGGKGAVVARARLSDDLGAPALESLEIIWRQSPRVDGNGHFGHRIAFGPDGMLYISSGERQKFTPAQDMAQTLGKVIRLTDSGGIPADNPFAGQGGVTAQIWSLGHRNPLGLAFDADGRLWEMEMGPAGGDELNIVTRGGNYGYPIVSNGNHYDGRDIPDHAPGDGYIAPRLWWNPVISPGGLMIYHGTAFPAWRGDAFIPALSGTGLVRVDLDGENARQPDRWNLELRVRAVAQDPAGGIWLLEDGGRQGEGRLYPPRPTRLIAEQLLQRHTLHPATRPGHVEMEVVGVGGVVIGGQDGAEQAARPVAHLAQKGGAFCTIAGVFAVPVAQKDDAPSRRPRQRPTRRWRCRWHVRSSCRALRCGGNYSCPDFRPASHLRQNAAAPPVGRHAASRSAARHRPHSSARRWRGTGQSLPHRRLPPAGYDPLPNIARVPIVGSAL